MRRARSQHIPWGDSDPDNSEGKDDAMTADGLKTGSTYPVWDVGLGIPSFLLADDAEGGSGGGAEPSGDSGGDDPGGDDSGESQTVTLPQEKIDEMFQEAYRKAFKKAKAEIHENDIKPLQQKLEEYDDLLADLRTNGAQGQGDGDQGDGSQGDDADGQGEDQGIPKEELQKHLEKRDEEWKKQLEKRDETLQEKDSTIDTLLHNQKLSSLQVAAANNGAINPDEVAKLIHDQVGFDPDNDYALYVQNESGGKRFNSEGDPLTVAEYVSEFLGERPHLVRSDFKAGGGSKGGGPGSGDRDIDAEIRQAEKDGDMQRAIRLKREKAFQG